MHPARADQRGVERAQQALRHVLPGVERQVPEIVAEARLERIVPRPRLRHAQVERPQQPDRGFRPLDIAPEPEQVVRRPARQGSRQRPAVGVGRARRHRVDGHRPVADHPDVGDGARVPCRDAAEAGIAAGHRAPAFGGAREEQAQRHRPRLQCAAGPGRRGREGRGLRRRRPPAFRRPCRRPASGLGDLRQVRRERRVFQDARAERVDRRERPFAERADQARHAGGGGFVQLQRVRAPGPEPAPEDAERPRAGHGADRRGAVLDGDVLALEQHEAQIARQIGMLEIARPAGARPSACRPARRPPGRARPAHRERRGRNLPGDAHGTPGTAPGTRAAWPAAFPARCRRRRASRCGRAAPASFRRAGARHRRRGSAASGRMRAARPPADGARRDRPRPAPPAAALQRPAGPRHRGQRPPLPAVPPAARGRRRGPAIRAHAG